MEDLSVTIAGIDFKLRKLTGQHKQLLIENTELEAKVKEQEKIINNQKQLINELQGKIKTVNIAKTLASRFEISDAKNRIGDLVREIDKCIDLLNK
jgi:predicted RNase H-like nuclease (RuvC/YqgF family)